MNVCYNTLHLLSRRSRTFGEERHPRHAPNRAKSARLIKRSGISLGIPIAFQSKSNFFLGKTTKLVWRSRPRTQRVLVGFSPFTVMRGSLRKTSTSARGELVALFLFSFRRAFAQDDTLVESYPYRERIQGLGGA